MQEVPVTIYWRPYGCVRVNFSEYSRVSNHYTFVVNISPAVLHDVQHIQVGRVGIGPFDFISVIDVVSYYPVYKDAEVEIFISELVIPSTHIFWICVANYVA